MTSLLCSPNNTVYCALGEYARIDEASVSSHASAGRELVQRNSSLSRLGGRALVRRTHGHFDLLGCAFLRPSMAQRFLFW
jgi:hypothetical protein